MRCCPYVSGNNLVLRPICGSRDNLTWELEETVLWIGSRVPAGTGLRARCLRGPEMRPPLKGPDFLYWIAVAI